MERLGKLVKQLKEAVQTRDIAEVIGVEEYDPEYDAQEASVVGRALINVVVTGSDVVKGALNWSDIEEASKGILRSLEYQIVEMLQDRVARESKVELSDGSEYTPDWETHGAIAWINQPSFKVKRGEAVETEIEIAYRHEVG